MEYELSEILSSLTSSDEGEVIEALKYITRHGDDTCFVALEPLQNHQSVSVRYFSRRAVAAIHRRLGTKTIVAGSSRRSVTPTIVEEVIPEPVFESTIAVKAVRPPAKPLVKPRIAEPITEGMTEEQDESLELTQGSTATIEEAAIVDVGSTDDLQGIEVEHIEPILVDHIATSPLEEESTDFENVEYQKPATPTPVVSPIIEEPPQVAPVLESVQPISSHTMEQEEQDEILLILQRNDSAAISVKLDELMRLGTACLDSKVVQELERYLKNTEDTFLQSKLVKIIGRHGSIKNLETLCEFLNSPDFRVIANTIESLEFLNDPIVMKHVAPFLRHEDNRIKANAAKCIWHLDSEKGILVLKKMISSGEFYYRDSGVFILGQIQCEESYQLLLEAYIQETDEELIAKIQEKISDVWDRYPKSLLEDVLESISEDKTPYIVGLLECASPPVSAPLPVQTFAVSEAEQVATQNFAEPEISLSFPEDELSSDTVEDNEISLDEISLDGLAAELSLAPSPEEEVQIEISLDGFDEITETDSFDVAPQPSLVPSPPHVDLNVDLEMDLTTDDIEEESFELLPPAPSKPLDEEDPRQKFAKKRLVPQGEDLLAMLAKGDVNSIDELNTEKPAPSTSAVPDASLTEGLTDENAKPLAWYLRHIQNPDENLRVESLLGLYYYHAKDDISEDERDDIDLYLSMARSDSSQKIRNIISGHQ